MVTTWILLADAHRAEIWERRGDQAPESVRTLEPTTQHQFKRDIGSDRPGRAIASSDGRHAAVEPHVDPLVLEHQHFATELTTVLDQELAAGRFDRLAIFAAPKMLGLLRESRDQKLAKVVVSEAPKDLTKSSPADIRAQIIAALP
jgi:protein required for attachment to host cells